MEECTKNVEVGKMWSEQDMVYSFGGGEIPGTPDGMFEDTAGRLTCVQVVRVPVLADMSSSVLADRMLETVLTKVLKSQAWMKATRIVPDDFVVFCWLLPLGRPRDLAVALRHSRSLIKRVRSGGWPFSLHVTVPDEPEKLFPSQFARHWRNGHRMKMPNMADIVAFRPSDFEEEEEPSQWDIFTIEFDEGGAVSPEDDLNGSSDQGAHEEQGVDDGAEECGVSPVGVNLQEGTVEFRTCPPFSCHQCHKQAQKCKPSPRQPGGDDECHEGDGDGDESTCLFIHRRQRRKQAKGKPSQQKPGGDDEGDKGDDEKYDDWHAAFMFQQHLVAFCALFILCYFHRLRQEKPRKPLPQPKPSWALAPLVTLAPFLALWSSMIPLTSPS
jgi:hypothetical protein